MLSREQRELVQQKTTEEAAIERFIIHRSWGKYTASREGRTGRYREGADRDRVQRVQRGTGPGAHDFIRAGEWRALGFLAEARLINLNQKNRALVSSTGVS